MKFIRGIHNLKLQHKKCAITIGNFDGFHLGHQKILDFLKKEGNRLCIPTMVILFEPQPKEYFLGNSAPYRLMKLRDKIKYLYNSKINFILCISFNEKVKNLSAFEFVKKILIKQLNIQMICIGENFKFGCNREGNTDLIKKMGNMYKFKVFIIQNHSVNGLHVSSTIIRQMLLKDNIIESKMLLGRFYSFWGRIMSGNMLGRRLGFSTANLFVKNQNIPMHGVYIVIVQGLYVKNSFLPGIANIGFRPTVENNKNKKIEVHLLDVNENLYGKYMEVFIIHKVRKEMKFSSLRDLKNQIKKDIFFTKKYFQNRNIF